MNDFKREMIDCRADIDYYHFVAGRLRALLAEAHAWCALEKGRQSALAAKLGVSRQAVSTWFQEYTKEHPKKQPTAEQALELAAFMKSQQHRRSR